MQEGSVADCMPLGSLYYYLKNSVTSVNEKDMEGLYRCTLCNNCRLADLNLGVRNAAVSKGIIAPHLARLRSNIREFGNPYGITPARKKDGTDNKDIVLFAGCTIAYKAPEIFAATERLLQRNGIEYGVMGDEACCGSILFNLGDRASGLEAVWKNIEKFKAAEVKRIITICPGCYEAFNKYYRGQEGFDAEVVLALDLIKDMSIAGDGYAVQDPCHAREKAGAVRSILRGARNESAGPCCGAGGGLMAHDLSLAALKARKVADGGDKKIVTYCPFCYMNLSSARPGKVIDLYVLLDNHNNSKASV
jgi:fumarate reductase (CoM/CoB) subunit B